MNQNIAATPNSATKNQARLIHWINQRFRNKQQLAQRKWLNSERAGLSWRNMNLLVQKQNGKQQKSTDPVVSGSIVAMKNGYARYWMIMFTVNNVSFQQSTWSLVNTNFYHLHQFTTGYYDDATWWRLETYVKLHMYVNIVGLM